MRDSPSTLIVAEPYRKDRWKSGLPLALGQERRFGPFMAEYELDDADVAFLSWQQQHGSSFEREHPGHDDPDDADTSVVDMYLDGRVAFVRPPLQIGNSQLRKLLPLHGVTDEKSFSRKMDEMFDPVFHSSAFP
jgi:hypothetical protein